MELTVGAILEGKVKSITNFGAFVALPDNKTGMVHISEVANSYVSDIRQHLTEGQDVKVMVISAEAGKINLSIKRLEPKPQRDNNAPRRDFRQGGAPRRENSAPQAQGQAQSQAPYQPRTPRTPTPPPAPKTADQLFEEKLKAFMTESDSKIASMKQYSDRSRGRRR